MKGVFIVVLILLALGLSALACGMVLVAGGWR